MEQDNGKREEEYVCIVAGWSVGSSDWLRKISPLKNSSLWKSLIYTKIKRIR